jgi:hypothetical protein
MRLKLLTTILIISCFHKSIWAQTEENLRQWASEIIETMAADSEEEVDFSFLMDDLIRLYHSPININSASRNELAQIVFLTDAHIEALLFQRYQVKQFNSLFELQAVAGYTRQLIEWLEPLLVFEAAGEAELRKFRPRGDLFIRAQRTLEKPKGYITQQDGTTPFQGNRLKLYSRLQIQPLRNVDIGFVSEKDPGEPMFNSQIPTMDYISGYISWKPDKFIKQIIIGQYRMSAGQGLALQTAMAPRKSSMTTTVRNRHSNFRPSLSVSESVGLNGVLVALGNRDLTFTPFVSVNMRDGRLSINEDGETIITSLKTDGYHRTLTELDQRKNVREDIYGAQLKYYRGRFILEGGFVSYQLQYPLSTALQPYNLHYFRGNRNNNGWFAFEGSMQNIYLFTEAAFNNSPEPAIWSGMLFSPANQMNMVLAYRRIPLDYKAPLGAPMTEAGQPAGESGLYTGVELGLPGKLTIAAYLDYFEHKWLRYQTKSLSNGYDFLSLLTHRPKRGWENSIRYRHKEKTANLKLKP